MASKYFVKRGEKVHGPFSPDQIQSGLDSGKVKSTDLISESSAGPWQSVQGSQSPPLLDEATTAEDDLFGNLELPEAAPLPAFPAQSSVVEPAAQRVASSPSSPALHELQLAEQQLRTEEAKEQLEAIKAANFSKVLSILIILAMAIGFPAVWFLSSNFSNYLYGNKGAYSSGSGSNPGSAGSTPSKSNDPVKRFEEIIMTQILERSVPQTYVEQQFELGDRSKPFWVKWRLSWNPTYNIEKTNSLTTPLQATVYINAKKERVNPPAGDLYGHRTKSGVIASQDWKNWSVDIESMKPFFFGYQDGEWRFTPTERQTLYYGTKGAPWPITNSPTLQSRNDDYERID